ncbi:Chromosome segregation in meiosis protein 3 [Nakaseomyces bracarensis]|uniref:Chromosome segregation in meiosis protein n=1 Tax=Nakaseomyces bracarensis TaxID=273131 RepID=A0ABR4NVN5_9SACH
MDDEDMLMLGVGADELNTQPSETTQATDASDPTMIINDPTAVNTKKRRPQVRLTAEKLLSSRGLPYVAKNAPKRVRISKSKSTYENLSNIVQFYQLWAHELFPKARFKEFVRLCNSLGKSDIEVRNYRMEIFRRDMEAQFGGGPLEANEAQSSSQAPVTSTQNDGANKDIHSTRVPEEKTGGPRLFEEEDDDIYAETVLPSRASTDTTAVPEQSRGANKDKMSSEPPSSSTMVDQSRDNIGFDEEELLAMEEEMNNIATQKISQLDNEEDNDDQSMDEDEDAYNAMKELGF